jgi:hypothetical protein
MKKKKKQAKSKPEIIEPVIYTPPDAEMNYSNKNSPPPKTKYEKHRSSFKRKEVRDLTKGKYGRDKDD